MGISVDQLNLTKIDLRGDGWYSMLKFNKETSTSLKDRLVKGKEQRGNCSLLSKAQRRISKERTKLLKNGG
jgi:hypothetical protein